MSTPARGTRKRTSNGDVPGLTDADMADMPTTEEIRSAMKVMDRFMRNEATRSAWLAGFLMGSSLRDEVEDPETSAH